MNRIELISVGKLKFREFQSLEEKYLQRIQYYVKFSLKNLREQKVADEKVLRVREGEQMLSALSKQDHVVCLDVAGRRMNSTDFAAFIGRCMAQVPGRLVFMVGGHTGFSEAVLARANERISFSPMTFPHDLFRILFLEQLYRALTIVKGHSYHR